MVGADGGQDARAQAGRVARELDRGQVGDRRQGPRGDEGQEPRLGRGLAVRQRRRRDVRDGSRASPAVEALGHVVMDTSPARWHRPVRTTVRPRKPTARPDGGRRMARAGPVGASGGPPPPGRAAASATAGAGPPAGPGRRRPAMIPPMPELRSIAEARADVLAHVRPLRSEEVVGRAGARPHLVADVRAAADVPAFANSAMDGFAVRAGPAGRTLRVVGESRAGAPFDGVVGEGEAVRTSTGAALPDGRRRRPAARARRGGPRRRDVIAARRGRGRAQRARRRQRRRGGHDRAARGHAARPGRARRRGRRRAGRCASARARRVAILTTGDELRRPAPSSSEGQLHDSNGVALAALAAGEGGRASSRPGASPTADATRAAIAQALGQRRVVLLAAASPSAPTTTSRRR